MAEKIGILPSSTITATPTPTQMPAHIGRPRLSPMPVWVATQSVIPATTAPTIFPRMADCRPDSLPPQWKKHPQAFIAWGCFFHCGGSESGLQSAILGNIVGAVVAGITLWVATQTGIGDSLGLPIWAGICVGVGVAVMVLLGNIPIFSAIPAQVYGFASVVALTLLGNGAGNLSAASMANPVVVIILSMIVGAIFGWVSEKIAGLLAGSGHGAHAKA